MSQHPFNIINQTASATRVDLNNALGALASLSSGTGQPTTTFANMLWYETSTNWLWIRNESDTDWVRFAYFNQSTNKSAFVDDTQIVNTSGTQVGLLGDQSTGTWQAGTGTTQSLVSPANVKSAILALTSTYTQPTATGAIGTYALLRAKTSASATPAGTLVSGSTMAYADADWNYSGTPSGTWRAMGYAVARTRPTVYLRTS